jgi:hypothetical protein
VFVVSEYASVSIDPFVVSDVTTVLKVVEVLEVGFLGGKSGAFVVEIVGNGAIDNGTIGVDIAGTFVG